MRNKFFVFYFLLFWGSAGFSQNYSDEFHLLFYNVENLFDFSDDPESQDEEFTPSGLRHWTYKKMNKKILDLSKVILNSSGWIPPQMIALCEVENRYVLEKLLSSTPLKTFSYKIIHKESPDQRGIDVVFLYESTTFLPIEYQYIPVRDETGNILNSREILYVSGVLNQIDTLHIFVNHWPSRYGGLLESRLKRNLAAQTLRCQTELLFEKYHNPKIIITGDFNDQPEDESLLKILGALRLSENPSDNYFYNLSYDWLKHEIKTIKYRSQWMVFDQIIVSGSFLDDKNSLYTRPEWAQIVNLPFLLEKDSRYGGKKIKRTYHGFKYTGGFSDHLPVGLKIKVNSPNQQGLN
jgi:endonuclease/exonuclease/phosphatase family metal-dependent hydrolase